MPLPAFPADRAFPSTRRILLAAILSLAAIRVIPSLLGPEDTGEEEFEARVLPSLATPIAPLGPGHLLAPFEADEVDHTAFGWALLDRTAGEVLVLDSTGRVHRQLGNRGAGPGELELPSRVGLGPGAEVAVLDAAGQRLDLFPGSGLPRRIPIPAGDCSGTFGDEVIWYAPTWWILRRCFDGPNADIEVLRVLPDGTPDRVERRTLTRMNSDPYLVPMLLVLDGVLYAGSNRESCLTEVGKGPSESTRLCLPQPVPIEIPDSTATRMFGSLGRRAAAVGLDFEIPSHFPAIVDVRVGPFGPTVRTILEDGSDAWAYESEETLRVLTPRPDVRVEPGESSWLLLGEEGAGLRVWVVFPS